MSRSPSPTGSASSFSSTMSRPAAPSKPSHLASAVTGTCGSAMLHNYIQTHQTGGSFTSALDTPSGTVGKTQFGYGYRGADGYTNTFDFGSDDERSDSRPTLRGRTHTAPSVSRIFNPAADQDAGDGTSRLIRNEPIAITGQGPSKVGKLRDLFEASSAEKAEPPALLSKQDTGRSAKGKPRISNTVRKLQAQLTGESIDEDIWNMDQFKRHSQDASSQSVDTSEYGTAKESLLKDALKMDAVVTPPDLELRTISQSSSAGNLYTPKLNRSLMDHDRDDSTATIKPLQRRMQEPETPMSSTTHQGSPQSASSNRFRLTSIFASSPKSSAGDNSGLLGENGPESPTRLSASPRSAQLTSQPDLTSMLQSLDSDDDNDPEKSRDPSVLEAETDIQSTSQHLRANDGSCFDLDWGANVSPTKSRTADQTLSLQDGDTKSEPASQNAVAEDTISQPSGKLSDQAADTPTTAASTAGGDSAPASTFSESRPPSGGSRILRPGTGKAAVALFDFEGEATFNELSLVAGQAFEIISEELAGGWSLGVVWSENEPPRRGLIPQGWYSLDPNAVVPQEAKQAIQASVEVPIAEAAAKDPGVEAVDSQTLVAEPIAELSNVEIPASAAEVEPRPELPLEQTFAPVPLAEASLSAPVGPSEADSQQLQSSPRLVAEAAEQPHELAPMPENVQKRFATDSAAQERISNRPSESKIFSASQAERILQFEQLLAQSADERPPARQSIDGLPPLSPALQSLNEIIKPSEPPEHVQETTVAPPVPTGKASIFGKKTFNRFASFVTSGAEDYVMSSADNPEDEQLRSIARKVSGGNTTTLASLRDEQDEPADVSVQSSLHGAGEAPQLAIEADQNHHFVVAGPAGPKWKSKTPTFLVQVHHPEKRSKMNGMQEYTIYHVTSTFPAHDPRDENGFPILSEDESQIPYDPIGGPYPSGAQVTVVRRFTQFEWLYQALTRHFAALGIPPVPEKQYSGRFASDFIETRRADLEMWMSRLVRHPVLRYSEPLQFFLSCEDDAEWRARAGALLREDTQGGFFARTWHPDFNFDAVDAAAEAESMEVYLKAMEKTINGVGGDNVGKAGVLSSFKGHRDGNVQTSSTYRDMSYTMLRMLTGAGAGNNDSRVHDSALTHDVHGPPMGNIGKKGDSGATNEHGAWCWREACHDCTNLTSALQNTAESLQDVADLYDHHARDTLLRQHERVKDASRPHASIHALLETHNTTLAKYRVANGEADGEHGNMHPVEAEKLAARCETVLNVTLSEMDRIHDERVEDWHALGRTFLDSEIELYEGILETLRAARLHYEPQYYDRDVGTHVLASRYQPDLYRPRKPPAPLQMPSQAQVPSGGLGANVGMLLSQATGGVTRPASAAAYAEANAGVRDSATPASGVSPSGFVSNLLARSKRSHSNIAAAASAPQTPSSPNKTGSMFSEFTNLPLPPRAEPYSQAGATLKAISQKQQHEDQRSSYFSAIWR